MQLTGIVEGLETVLLLRKKGRVQGETRVGDAYKEQGKTPVTDNTTENTTCRRNILNTQHLTANKLQRRTNQKASIHPAAFQARRSSMISSATRSTVAASCWKILALHSFQSLQWTKIVKVLKSFWSCRRLKLLEIFLFATMWANPVFRVITEPIIDMLIQKSFELRWLLPSALLRLKTWTTASTKPRGYWTSWSSVDRKSANIESFEVDNA